MMANRNGSSKAADEKIQVTVRCRPTNHSERQHRIKKVVECNSKAKEISIVTGMFSLGLSAAQQTKVYNFDKVFGPNSTQLDIYKNVVESQLQDVLAGYNCTVLAYGQTGTGKTYTMEGERTMDQDYSWDKDPRAGIIPRALSQLFDCLEKAGCEFSVRVSLLEIYNEEIYDLLSHSANVIKMKIYEDNSRKGSVVVSGLTEVHVRDKSEVYSILEQGAIKRRTAATHLNEFSSRSHSVFSITVHTKDVTHSRMEEEELVKIGKLNLVDLAGSENIGRSGAVDKRAREAGNINQSLLTLGRCITALVDRAPHVPYRESKLTRLLQDSLGGATKTSIIATISPGNDNLDETMSTLDYAARAKNIHNKPRVNQKLTKRALIKEYDDEIEKLRREVVALREKNGVYVDPKQYDGMIEKIEQLTATVEQRQEEVNKFQELFSDSQRELQERTHKLSTLQEDLDQTRVMLAEQSALKEAYAEHGKEMVVQATKLQKTVGVVTTDIELVHDKVDRVKNLNENNLNTVASFSDKFKDEFHLLCAGTMGLFHQTKLNMDNLLSEFGKMSNEQNGNLAALNSEITNSQSCVTEAFKETIGIMNMVIDDISKGAGQHEDALRKQTEVLKSLINECMSLTHKKDENVVELVARITHDVQESTRLQYDQVQRHIELTNKHDQEVVEYVGDMKSKMSTFIEAQNKANEIQAQANKQIQEIWSSTKRNYDNAIKKSERMQESTTDWRQKTTGQVDQLLERAKETELKIVNAATECTTTLERAAVDTTASTSTIYDAIEEHNRNLSNIFATMGDGCTVHVKSCNQRMEVASESVSSYGVECRRQISVTTENMKKSTSHLKSSICGVKERIKVGESAIAEGRESITSTVEECAENVDRIVPTGVTPARKTYDRSTRIYQPPLQEDVLVTFRERLQREEELQDEEEGVEEDMEEEEAEQSDSESSMSFIDTTLNQSITIPDVGGLPFFKKQSAKSKLLKIHPASKTIASTRIPLRSTQNINH